MSSDKIYPARVTKPTPNPTANLTFPATKSQQYGASTLYRPQSPTSPTRPPSRRRSRCYSCLFYSAVIVLLAAVVTAILYAIYSPSRPEFSLSSFQISALNLSSSASFVAALSLSVSARNPNSKISLSYDTTSVSASSSAVRIAGGVIPVFAQPAKKTTVLKVVLNGKGIEVGDGEISALKSVVKSEGGLDLEIAMETKVRFGIGRFKIKKFRVRVSCVGMKANVDSKGKFGGRVNTDGPICNCKAKLPFKIWKWNFSF